MKGVALFFKLWYADKDLVVFSSKLRTFISYPSKDGGLDTTPGVFESGKARKFGPSAIPDVEVDMPAREQPAICSACADIGA